jgi:hypothetical protein
MSSTADRGQPAGVHLELTDPRVMRAMTHPVRLALIEALEAEGSLTATQAGELIGEPPNSCSFHFRQLAKYGFVEEAGQGPGHARPWRLRIQEVRFPDLYGTSDTAVAARALKRLVQDRYFARLAEFEQSRASYPVAWREAENYYQDVIHLSAAEVEAVCAEFGAILGRYRERTTDPSLRPADSLPVEVVTIAYPRRPPRRSRALPHPDAGPA